MSNKTYHRYVAIGDSTTEGIDDPDGNGSYRGWANRFAELIAQQQGGLLYANLAVRGLRTREILEGQLERALGMKPDLSTVVSGTNDVLRSKFDPDTYARDIEYMQRALIAQGATVLTFTLPDLSRVNPIARMASSRIGIMNGLLRDVSQATGAIVVDLAVHPVASDPRLWSVDRLHANAAGHTRIAAALADAIQLPGSNNQWSEPLAAITGASALAKAAEHFVWSRAYLWPWIKRRVRGQSSGDGIRCKRPALAPVLPVSQ